MHTQLKFKKRPQETFKSLGFSILFILKNDHLPWLHISCGKIFGTLEKTKKRKLNSQCCSVVKVKYHVLLAASHGPLLPLGTGLIGYFDHCQTWHLRRLKLL